jgi:hypothetical protein
MLDERIINRLRELDVEDDALVLMSYMYDNGDINEEDIFDIGDDDEFNIENINMYELNNEPTVDTYTYGNNVSYNFEDWYIFNNYDDAVSEAEEATRELIDEIGIEGINFSYLGGIEKYVDEDWFEDVERESFEGYCYDIANETDYTYDNRLVAECYDEGLIEDTDFETDEEDEPNYSECLLSTDELVERYVDYHMSRIDDFIEEFKFNFGEREFNDTVIERNLIDIDELVSDIVGTDGPANSLAGYDGNEVNYDFDGITYYMYRNN